jgi:hypothetical protein
LLFLVIAISGRAANEPGAPTVTLELPPDTAKIHYYMSGPFGGYGRGEPRRWTGPRWNIITAVNGQPADRIRVIAYSADCRLMTVDLRLKKPAHLQRTISCEPLNTVTIPVTIVDPAPPLPDTYELEVLYMADWSLDFFGITYGMPATFPVRLRPIGRDGTLDVRVPDLMQDPGVTKWKNRGYFMFFLQDRVQQTMVGRLVPADHPELPGVPVQERYAAVKLKLR